MNNDKSKVALYIRVSTDKQVNDGYGLDDQKKRLEQYCCAKGYDMYKIYCDKGESAKEISHRKYYNKMLEDMIAKKFSKILTIKLDRISRSTKDFYMLLETIKENDCELEFIDTPLDLNGSGGKMMAGILCVFAEFERELIVDRTLRGVNEAAHNGHFGGKPPLGYKKAENSKCLVIDEEKSPIIEEIFNLCLKGNTYAHIANIMNEKYSNMISCYRTDKITGEKKPIYRNWKDSSICVILNNKTYIGIHEHRKTSKDKETTEIVGKIPPIISKEVFNECQENIKRNSRNYYRSKNYLFLQKLKCPKCGRILACTGTTKANGSEYLYYKCRTKNCDTYIREEQVEKVLIEHLVKYLELYLILEENYFSIDTDLAEDFNNCKIDNKIRFAIDSRIANELQNNVNIEGLKSIWELNSYETKCKFIYEFIDYIEVKKYKVNKEKEPRVKIMKLQLKPHKIRKLFELKSKNMIDDIFTDKNNDFTITEFRSEEQAYQYIDILKKRHKIAVNEYVKGEEYYFEGKTFKVINIIAKRAVERNKSIFISLEN